MKKRKLEEAEAEADDNLCSPKKRNQPGKHTDKDFTTDSDVAEEDGEKNEEEEKKKDKAENRPDMVQGQ